MAAGDVTQIDANYLNTLKGQLQDQQKLVQDQLTGLGTNGVSWYTTNYINPVNNLPLLAGPSGFEAGTTLAQALTKMGGSVYDQLTWLNKVLTDMISEITTTVNSFSGTESLNNEAVDKLISDFQRTIGDMGHPASSSTSNPNTPGQ